MSYWNRNKEVIVNKTDLIEAKINEQNDTFFFCNELEV